MFRFTILNLMHVTVIVGLCSAVARLVAFDTVSLVSAVLWSSIAGLWLYAIGRSGTAPPDES
jgi:hypothetical protein